MTSQEFRRENPEFSHRLLVRKTWDPDHPLAAEVSLWLKRTFGPRGDRWRNQPLASVTHLVYWFKDERDFSLAILRWS